MRVTSIGSEVPRSRAAGSGSPAQDSYAYGFEDQRRNGGVTVVILTNQDRCLVPAIQRTEALLTGPTG